MNRKLRFMRPGSLYAAALVWLFSTPALATPDVFYPSTVTNVAVDGAPATVTSNLASGTNGSTSFDAAVFPAQELTLRVTWAIRNNSAGPGVDTSYPKTITFSSDTDVTPGPLVTVVNSATTCATTSAASICTTDLTLTAPAAAGGYSVEIQTAASTGGGPLPTRNLHVSFTVEEPVVEKLATQLTIDPDPVCVILNAGNKDLMATLRETVSSDPVPGKSIDYYVDPELDDNDVPTPSSVPVGAATTDGSGQATLSYDVSGLDVGDHLLYAEFDGDDDYYGSNDTGVLGVSYLFVGFQQPINPEGNSVFGNGRVIPIKIRLTDANGQSVADAAPTVWMTSYSAGTGLGDVLEAATSVSSADTGNVMRYVPEDEHYIYNWDLSSLQNGTYGVVVELDDSPACSTGPYYAVITVAKKGKK